MSDVILTKSDNPISLDPGPDLNIRTHLHRVFESHRNELNFSLEDWTTWTEAEQANAIRALANDYLESHGRGFDWVTAGQEAEFVLAGTFHEVAYRSGIQPAPPLYLSFFDPFMGEGLELRMEPPSDIPMDPVPGAPIASVSQDSQRARATLMVAPPGDALKAVDKALVTGLGQISEFFQATHRLPLVFMGAALTIWKAMQVSHHVRAGAVFRGIRNPNDPAVPEGSMRILYARSSPQLLEIINANLAEANLFLD